MLEIQPDRRKEISARFLSPRFFLAVGGAEFAEYVPVCTRITAHFRTDPVSPEGGAAESFLRGGGHVEQLALARWPF